MAVFPYATPIFQPAIRQIAAITPVLVTGTSTLLLGITTTQDHLYKDGLIVRLSIPLEFGAQQLNGRSGDIVVNTPTQFIMSFTAFPFDPFVIPATPLQVPLSIPIAEDVQFLNSAEFNVLP